MKSVSLPNIAYWGGVADNAREVANFGSSEDKADVLQMLNRAVALLKSVNAPLPA